MRCDPVSRFPGFPVSLVSREVVGMRNPGLALLNILLLDMAGLLTAWRFSRHSMTSFLLLIPYALWIAFATYLNVGFFVLNGA